MVRADLRKIRVKTPEQIEGIRRASQLAARTLVHLGQFVREGVTTGFLNDRAEEFMRDHGAVPAPLGYRGYPAATCISVNEVVCHGIPSDRILVPGDVLNVDVTAILDGYYGDTSTMYRIEPIGELAANLLRVTKECLVLGIEQLYPGNPLGNVGHAIASHAHAHGFSVVTSFCGHGVGLEFHELPDVFHEAQKDSGILLTSGMTLTVEPMINAGVAGTVVLDDQWTAVTVDGQLSAQEEHTVLVTPAGPEILTLAKPGT